MRCNPPAIFDNVLIDAYEALEKVVPNQHWLPPAESVLTLDGQEAERLRTAIAKGEDKYGYLKDALAKLGKKKRKLGFREYGAGHYGSVYPTAEPGVVIKITTDKTEAKFIMAAMSLAQKEGKWPRGIVRYHGIFQVADRIIRNRPVFILWRDEIQPGTLHDLDDTAPNYSDIRIHLQALVATKILAHELRMKLLRMKKIPKDLLDRACNQDYPEYLDAPFKAGEKISAANEYIRDLQHKPNIGSGKAVALMRAVRNGCENMYMSNSFDPGYALEYYLDRGILLADVHGDNVGRLPNTDETEWVISDPGHAVFLNHDFDHLSVPCVTPLA
jgi:hypothetical protein